ncbi:type 2 lanthipeptide synthetase LanM family protein [Kitasatospora sp. NPDC101183]|uniref:type 2 lanthipeptide synthetase LanM family protein n=1 Tax=Kitasatospora sp. NPDC101183 TaxID=3364100 RepID=UPI0037F8F386
MVDTSALRRAAARALPLDARGTAPAGAEGTDPDRAGRVLDRWRAQAPFDQPGWFDRRLAAVGLDQDGLRALLAESPDSLADRLGTPAWAVRLADAFEAGLTLDVPEDQAFARIAAPALAAARDRLRAGLAALPGLAEVGTPEALTALVLPALTEAAHASAVRTVITELHIARLGGELTGDTPAARYRDFLDRLTAPDRSVRLLADYPVLAYRLATGADQWADTCLALYRRLAADLPALARTFADGRPLGPLVELATGLGDPHRGGATVSSLRFEGGTRIVYKPRPLGAETHFQHLLHWLNPKLRLPLHDLAHLGREGYGWVAFVTAEPACDDAELSAFYHRAGSLAALLYLLDAVDCHAQNLLAVRDQPVLIDLEAVLHPDLPEPVKELSRSERLARHQAQHSVLRSGLLPERMWDEGNGGADLSALGWDPDNLPPRPAPVLVDEGTDQLRLEYRRMPVRAPGSRPVPPGQPLRLADHVGELEAGFTEAYRLLADHKAEVRKLVRAFGADETRMLRRDTFEYRSLLATACHPDLLRDGLDQERHLDRLWALAAWEEHAVAYLAHERADLWRGDVPLFTIRPDGTDARSGTGALVPDVTDRPVLDLALAKVDGLGEADLARQLRLLRISVTTADGAREPRRSPAAVPVAPGTGAVDRLEERALAKAVEVGSLLLAEAFRGEADLAWVGPNWTPPGRWAPAELGPDLYSGTAGVTLFLHQLALATGDSEHRAAATAAGVTLRHQVRRRADRLGGGLSGTGGVLYVLAHLAAHQDDFELDELARAVLARVVATAGEDEYHDLVAGNAGTIGGLLAWEAVRPGPAVTAALAACVDRLAAAALPHPEGGVGWLPASLAGTVTRPLAGLAHGGSGIAWSLARAGHRLGDARAAELALAAVAYERTLYSAEAGNWRDVREDGTPDGPAYPALWCHGAAGIALARTELAALLPSEAKALLAERDTAAATVLREGFGSNSSLCHGDLGNLDTLLLSGPTWRHSALTRAAAALDTLDTRGFVCGLPHGAHSPSLMVGLAGIGHGLLRLAAPKSTPSVLGLQPPA